jgi:hypothetical protein
MSQQTPTASLGFRVHAGWATAVALAGPASSPVVLLRRRIELWDPKVPESRGPWHAAMENPGPTAATLVERGSRAVRSAARQALERLLRELRERGHAVTGAGVVVNSDPDPSRSRGTHIHAHAAEAILYREALREAAAAASLPSPFLIERSAPAEAARKLRLSAPELERRLKELGRPVGPPWRADERSAALIAWTLLAP